MAPAALTKNAWIETVAIFLLGMTIGEGSVVAAGSFVTTDVPPRSIIDEAPAKFIKKLAHAEE